MSTYQLTAEDFGGNQEIFYIFNSLFSLVHIWDDLIDKDKPVTDAKINEAFRIALVHLPSSPLYRSLQVELLPIIISVIMAYDTANKLEATKEEVCLGASHGLRFGWVHILNHLMFTVFGYDEAMKYMPKLWRVIVGETFVSYMKEYQNV